MPKKINKIKKYCQYCSQIFYVVPSLNRIKFCSKKCYNKNGRDYKTIEKLKPTMFKKGHKTWNKNKSWSKNIREKISKTLKGYKLENFHKVNCQCFVCKAKRFELKGQNHPSYIKNLDRKYPIEFNNNLKINIRKRDKFICQLCNKHGWMIHHIDYNKQNNSKNNLITLCSRCHPHTNANRNYWQKILQQKVVNINKDNKN